MPVMTFPKYVVVSPTSGETASLSRTYSDKVTSTDKVAVSVNGQRISTDSTARFYYAVTLNTGAPTIQVTIYANPSYDAPGYSTSTNIVSTFSQNDKIYIDYQYEVTV